jgi:Rha family phage regulatory protein
LRRTDLLVAGRRLTATLFAITGLTGPATRSTKVTDDINSKRQPIVTIRDGEAFANSRDVAAFFDKEHRHVLDAIDKLIAAEPKLGGAEFSAGVYTLASTGPQQHRCFDMTRDGFALLAMGFTGTKALKWKLRYIEAFNIMEAELRERAKTAPMIDVNDPAQLRGLLLSYADKAQQLERQVDELLPSKDALHRLSEANGSLCITDAAKALQNRPGDLFSYLRSEHWIYRRAGTAHDIGYQVKVEQGLLEHKVTTVTRPDGSEKITEQVRVTPKGLARLALEMGSRKAA